MPGQITVTLPDGSAKSLPEGATAADLAASIGRGLAKAAVAAKVNGSDVDLETPLADETIEIMLKQHRRRWQDATGREL